jgi:hypothetical protein
MDQSCGQQISILPRVWTHSIAINQDSKTLTVSSLQMLVSSTVYKLHRVMVGTSELVVQLHAQTKTERCDPARSVLVLNRSRDFLSCNDVYGTRPRGISVLPLD